MSAGGVGFDINCGVRLLASPLSRNEVQPNLEPVLNQLFRDIPCGTGRRGLLNVAQDGTRPGVVERSPMGIAAGLWQ